MKPFRSPKYTKWVKSLPSVISGLPADDPHHLIGHGQGGMGTKASDLYTFPLTRAEHRALHDMSWKKWEALHGSQWTYVVNTLDRAIAHRVVARDILESAKAEAILQLQEGI